MKYQSPSSPNHRLGAGAGALSFAALVGITTTLDPGVLPAFFAASVLVAATVGTYARRSRPRRRPHSARPQAAPRPAREISIAVGMAETARA